MTDSRSSSALSRPDLVSRCSNSSLRASERASFWMSNCRSFSLRASSVTRSLRVHQCQLVRNFSSHSRTQVCIWALQSLNSVSLSSRFCLALASSPSRSSSRWYASWCLSLPLSSSCSLAEYSSCSFLAISCRSCSSTCFLRRMSDSLSWASLLSSFSREVTRSLCLYSQPSRSCCSSFSRRARFSCSLRMVRSLSVTSWLSFATCLLRSLELLACSSVSWPTLAFSWATCPCSLLVSSSLQCWSSCNSRLYFCFISSLRSDSRLISSRRHWFCFSRSSRWLLVSPCALPLLGPPLCSFSSNSLARSLNCWLWDRSALSLTCSRKTLKLARKELLLDRQSCRAWIARTSASRSASVKKSMGPKICGSRRSEEATEHGGSMVCSLWTVTRPLMTGLTASPALTANRTWLALSRCTFSQGLKLAVPRILQPLRVVITRLRVVLHSLTTLSLEKARWWLSTRVQLTGQEPSWTGLGKEQAQPSRVRQTTAREQGKGRSRLTVRRLRVRVAAWCCIIRNVSIDRVQSLMERKGQTKHKIALSFDCEFDGDDAGRGYGKSPGVLAVEMGQEAAEQEKERLRQLFFEESHKIKEQSFQIQVSHWDSPQHVKSIRAKKKDRVLTVLEKIRLKLAGTLEHLHRTATEDLLLVARDTILPHSLTIFEIEGHNLRSRQGQPLFDWQPVQLTGGESLLRNREGLVIVEKSRYVKAKEVHPFSGWQTVDLAKLGIFS